MTRKTGKEKIKVAKPRIAKKLEGPRRKARFNEGAAIHQGL